MSEGRRWRRQRDLAIATLYAAGWRQSAIADVFDLAEGRVSTILDGFEPAAGTEARESPEVVLRWRPRRPRAPRKAKMAAS